MTARIEQETKLDSAVHATLALFSAAGRAGDNAGLVVFGRRIKSYLPPGRGRDHIEAALALGATRWEVIRTAVLPHGRSGVVSASMLGLGRALGETIAVMIILTTPPQGAPFTPSIFAGGETFASKIANNAAEFDSPSKTGAYIAAGLVLFVVTFAVNAIARIVAERGAKS